MLSTAERAKGQAQGCAWYTAPSPPLTAQYKF